MADLDIPKQYDMIDGILAPSANNQLFGHNSIISFMGQMRQENRLHHALLFEGPQGVGKATLAFQLAWNVLTDQSTGFIAPNKDNATWRQIAQGSHPGLLYVSRRYDPKTEKFKTGISVEDIRDIMHLLSQTSYNGGWRVVIIDTADDMNRNAANAVLKTLEEPPEKTLFILISNFSGRLLPTIRSRCHSVIFRPLDKENLLKSLDLVLGELTPEQPMLDTLVEKAQGSVRKAALLIAYGGLEIIKTIDEILINPRFDPIKAQQLGQALTTREATIQFQQFTQQILSFISNKAMTLASKEFKQQANLWSEFWQNTNKEINETEAFNLDKKQFVVNLLGKIHRMLFSSV